MWVLLPETSSDPIALLELAVLSQAARRASTQVVRLSLPMWDFQSNLPLIEALQHLGMTAPFTDEADFSGITDVELSIDQVQHRADITVDEKGTGDCLRAWPDIERAEPGDSRRREPEPV